MQDSLLYGIIGFLIVILIIITVRKPDSKTVKKKEDTQSITPNTNCDYIYEDCNKPCGPGKQKLKILKPSSGTGTPCPTVLEKDCKIRDCPEDTSQQTPKNCVPGAWSSWSNCTATCGGGSQTRSRTITEPAVNGGSCDIQTTETRNCNTEACPVPKNCVPSAWSSWSNCTATCGVGRQTRSRLILEPASNGGTCNLETTETQDCNTQACPVPKNCVPGEWGSWSTCTASCGGGIQSRLREIVVPASNGGVCTEPTIETRDCNNGVCPVDQPAQNCVSTWSEWSNCTVPCGGGSQTRNRIIQVPASNGGTCDGQMTETRSCNLNACPEDCKLSNEMNESRCLENNKKLYIDILQSHKNGGTDCLDMGKLKDGKEWRYDGGNNRIVRDEACITPVDCKLGGVYEGECDWKSKKTLMADILSPPIGMGRSCSEMSNLIGDLQRWTHDLSNNKMFREVDCVRVENCKLGNVYSEWTCTNNKRVHSTNIFSEPNNGGKSCVQVAKENYGNYDWVLDPSGGKLNRVESCITPINCKLSLEQERGECINNNQMFKIPILSQPVGDGWSCEKVANQATAYDWQVSQDRSFVFRNKECISPVDCELGNLTIGDCSGGFSRNTYEVIRQRRGTGKICSTIASQNDMLLWTEDISNKIIYADKRCSNCKLEPSTYIGACSNNASLIYTRILDLPKGNGLSCIDMAKKTFGNFDWSIDPSYNTLYSFKQCQVSPGAIRFGNSSDYKSEFLFGETESQTSFIYTVAFYKDANNNFIGVEFPSNFQITPSSNIKDFLYCSYIDFSENTLTFKSFIPFSPYFTVRIEDDSQLIFTTFKPFNNEHKKYFIYIDRDCQLADNYTIGDCIFRNTQDFTFKITKLPLGSGKSCLQTALEKTNRKIEHVDMSSVRSNFDTLWMKTDCNIDCSLGGGITGGCIANTFRVSYPIIKNPVGQGQSCSIIAKQKYGDFTYFEDLSVNRVFRINNCTVPEGYIRFGTASNKKEEYEISQIANQAPFMKIVIYRNDANNIIGIELPSGLQVSANSTINDWIHGEYIYSSDSNGQSLIRLSTFNNLIISLNSSITYPIITIGQTQYSIRNLNCKLDDLVSLPCINNKIEHFYKINTPPQGTGRSCISEALRLSPGFNWLQSSDKLFRTEDCVNCDLSGLRIGECVNDKRLNTAFIKTFPSSNGTNCINTAKQLYGDKYWEQNNPNRWVSYIENCRECDLSGLEYGSCLNNNQILASRIIIPGMGGTSCVDMAKVKFTDLPNNTWSEDVGIIAVKTTIPCTIPTNRIRFGQVSDISTNFTIFENENRTGGSQIITVYYNNSNDVVGIEFPKEFSISSSTTNSFRNNIINFNNALFSFNKLNNQVFLSGYKNNFIRITLPKQATATSPVVNVFEFFDPIVGNAGIKRYYNNPPNIDCEFTYGQCDKLCGPGKQPLQIVKYPSGTGIACPTITSQDCKIKDCDADCKLSTNIQTSSCIQDNRILSIPILTGPVGEGLVCTSVAQQGNNFTWSQSSDNSFVFRNEACITPVDCSLQNLIISDCSGNKVTYTYDIKIPTRGEGKRCTLGAREMDGSLNWVEDLSRSLVFRTENCADCRLEPVSESTPYFGACVNNNRLAYVKILSLPQGRGKSCLDMVKQRFGNFDWQFDIGANAFYRLEQCNTVTGMIRFGNNSDKMEIVKFGTTTTPNVVINIVIYRNNLNDIIGVDVPSNFNFPDNVPITRFLYSTYYGFGSGNKLLFRSQIANLPQFSITLGESDIVFATVMNPTGNMFEKTQRYFRYVDQNCELAQTFKTIPCSSVNREGFEFTITTPVKGSGVTCLQRAIERTNTKPEYVTGSSTIGTVFKMNRVCNIDCSLGSTAITGGCSDNTNRIIYPVLRNKTGDGKPCDVVAKQLFPQFAFFNDTSLKVVYRLANCVVPDGYIRFGTISSNKTEYNISVVQNTAPFMKIVVYRNNNTNNIIGLELPKGLQITDTMTALNYVHGELIVSTSSTIRADVKVSSAINFHVTLYPDTPVPIVIFPGKRYFIKKINQV
jgi:hypothetical protein